MSGVSKLKHAEADEKKKIIAKKMGGTKIGKPNSWKKNIEYRNGEHEINEDMFTKGDRKKITKANKNDHGKEPKHSWEI